MKIVIADDDMVMQRLLLRVLAPLGHECLAASSIEELKRLCAKAAPDVIISDVVMGDGNGIDACLELKRLYPRAAVILITGDGAQASRALAEGFPLVLSKPFDLQWLKTIVEDLGRA